MPRNDPQIALTVSAEVKRAVSKRAKLNGRTIKSETGHLLAAALALKGTPPTTDELSARFDAIERRIEALEAHK